VTSLNITLPDEMKAFIDDQISSQGFASVSEYFQNLLREAQAKNARRALEVKLLEGLKGPITEMTPEDWDSIEQEANDRHANVKIGK